MSAMTDQGDDKDVLLEKLDGLIQSGRARRRRDPPPVLTEAIPTVNENNIPTLTDAVEVPATSDASQPAEHPDEQAEQPAASTSSDLDAPLDFEPAISVSSETNMPSGPEVSTPAGSNTATDHRQKASDNLQLDTPADLQESISSRLVDVIEREMSALIEQIPAHKSKLAVLQRSLRFALPELVRLRLQEDTAAKSDGDSDKPADTES